MMARPRLDPKIREARRAEARREAAKINKRLPQNVYAFSTPSGKVCIRYEPPHGPKKVMQARWPSIEFDAELLALRRGNVAPTVRSSTSRPKLNNSQSKTWRWLCEGYLSSPAFQRYTVRDQRVRRGLLERTWHAPLKATDPSSPLFGDMPIDAFQAKAIKTLRDRFACLEHLSDPMFPDDRNKQRLVPTKPEAGNSIVRCIRLVFAWALEELPDLIGGHNWGHAVRLLKGKGGHRTWGAEEVAAFERVHARGTQMRLIFDLAILTGQRLSDIARLGPGMVEASSEGERRLRFTQAKGRTKQPVTAFVPIFPELEVALNAAREAGILGSQTFVEKPGGGRYTAESLGNRFRAGCKTAGLHGYSIHGLRKTGVVNLIKVGCSTYEIMAITGHRTRKEIDRYARDYEREIAAHYASQKWIAHRSAFSLAAENNKAPS